jgi:broad-specificity NMP kinase
MCAQIDIFKELTPSQQRSLMVDMSGAMYAGDAFDALQDLYDNLSVKAKEKFICKNLDDVSDDVIDERWNEIFDADDIVQRANDRTLISELESRGYEVTETEEDEQ